MEYASFTSCPNELHRLRRGPLNKFFSRAMVLELQSIVQEKADKLCALITKNSKAGEMLDIHHGCRAVSIDVITEYMFNNCYDLLDAPDLGTNFFELVRGIGPALWVFQQWPELSIMNGLPQWMLKKMSPPLAQILNLQEVYLSQTTLLPYLSSTVSYADKNYSTPNSKSSSSKPISTPAESTKPPASQSSMSC
jgi:hypothetical protein